MLRCFIDFISFLQKKIGITSNLTIYVGDPVVCFWTLSIFLSLSKSYSVYISKCNISETGFCLHLQGKPTQLGPVNRASPEIATMSIDWAQLSRFYLKTDRIRSLKCCVLKYKQDGVLDKNRMLDNVQKHNVCTNGPSSKNFRSYVDVVMLNKARKKGRITDLIICLFVPSLTLFH
jgi:hypothetical protein